MKTAFARLAAARRARLSGFARDESGVMVIFGLYIFLAMILVAGIGVDVMRFERERANLQNTLDRAVLAAADLDQPLEPRAVVEDYFSKAGMTSYLADVRTNQGLSFREVTAEGGLSMGTHFMRMAGVDTLSVGGLAAARESIPNVEISLVLDISGSMRNNNRMDTLKPAAKNFVSAVLTGAAADTTSINLIPYAGQTNPGPAMFDYLDGRRVGETGEDHFPEWEQDISNITIWFDTDRNGAIDPEVDYSAKIEGYPDSDVEAFNKDDLDEYYYYVVDYVLRQNPELDRDTAAVGATIKGGEQTTTFYNIVTGEAMEAPKDYWTKTDLTFQFSSFYSDVLANDYSSCLELRSADFADANLPATGADQTPHFMYWDIDATVMDWGWCPEDDTAIQYAQNNEQALHSFIDGIRMHDGTGTFYGMKWALALLNPSSQHVFSYLNASGLVPDAFMTRPSAFNQENWAKYVVLMTDGQITEQFRPTDPLDPVNWDTELLNRTSVDRYQMSTRSTNLARFYSQCDLAKQNGIVIFTIAFDAPSGASGEMRNCASSPAHFFEVSGTGLGEAFTAIARQINQLRLTQ